MSFLHELVPSYIGINIDAIFLGLVLGQFAYWKLKCERTEGIWIKCMMVSDISHLSVSISSGRSIRVVEAVLLIIQALIS